MEILKKKREMVFFDVETAAAPTSESRQQWWILEFGAILVCPRRLVELSAYTTLIRPSDPSAAVSKRFAQHDLEGSPTFAEVAGDIHALLHGRVWAGHNIRRFDVPRLRAAFAAAGLAAPEPAAVLDSLDVLASDFGRRAGDLKMATLAAYFGIGKQRHRGLDDARLNLQVLKHCAAVLMLESSLPPGLLSGDAAAAALGDGAVTRRRASHRNGSGSASPASPSSSSSSSATAAAVGVIQKGNNSCKKRDSMGKVLVKQRKQGAAGGTTTMAAAARRRRVTATPPAFSMILRHSSRAVIR